ncbi:ABC transporter substrate-binding protein [Cognatiyoonia sp. IB215182]|uniref:ABC transporter substrate-binding protein n=1 Tax=Cognatiyoonia sp. IB215182 TaxID=3097353 RepID=UPI002A15EB9E|nr:ABC transporter substrate-binding protein [Cognatiyoonia sp. IB215182]MDX8354784.1 ABC transporter substrate-binding protein [Cognatiyoonia sp. IB215182]
MKRLIITVGLLTLTPLLAGAQDTWTIVDDNGTTITVPANPTRIVAIDNQIITAPLYELGYSVVGTVGREDANINDGKPFMRSLTAMLGLQFDDESGITYIGNWREPDLELIASLNPDLIITITDANDVYDKLAVIAPTAAVEFEQPMLDIYAKVAEIVGETEQFEERRALYQARVATTRGLLEDQLGPLSDITVAVVEPTFDEGIWITRDLHAFSQVAADLGFGMPDFYKNMPESWAQISAEAIQESEADFMVGSYTTIFPEDQPADKRAAFEANLPGWNEFLHAPRNNQHFFLNREEIRPVMFSVLETTMAVVVSQMGTREFVPFEE